MFKRIIFTNARYFSHAHPPSIIPNSPINNVDKETIKGLKNIISNQNKTIDNLKDKYAESFGQGFVVGMLTNITMMCLSAIF
jgi:hypothetical protein